MVEVGYPKLIFGCKIHKNKVQKTWIAAVKDTVITKSTRVYYYPFSNVHQTFELCWGGNVLPEVSEAWQISFLPRCFLGLPKNSDLLGVNKKGLAVPDLLRELQGKDFDDDLLVDTNQTFDEWIINKRG